jgi:hypothetical protein
MACETLVHVVYYLEEGFVDISCRGVTREALRGTTFFIVTAVKTSKPSEH